MQELIDKVRQFLRHPGRVGLLAFVVWLVVVLGLAWGTVPLLTPPNRLIAIIQMLFYRDYLF